MRLKEDEHKSVSALQSFLRTPISAGKGELKQVSLLKRLENEEVSKREESPLLPNHGTRKPMGFSKCPASLFQMSCLLPCKGIPIMRLTLLSFFFSLLPVSSLSAVHVLMDSGVT